MAGIWVVAANQVRARIFEREKRNKLNELKDLVNPESRLREQDLTSDQPGRVVGMGSPVRHGVPAAHSKKEQAAERFARELCELLFQARDNGGLDNIVLIAPPAFLGQLRSHMDAPTRRLVSTEIAKNVVEQPVERILETLRGAE